MGNWIHWFAAGASKILVGTPPAHLSNISDYTHICNYKSQTRKISKLTKIFLEPPKQLKYSQNQQNE